jgi:hypothetical protein
MNNLNEYPRHRLDERQLKTLLREAQKIAGLLTYQQRVAVIARALAENASLAAECNEHRAARGLEPLQTYEPEFKK